MRHTLIVHTEDQPSVLNRIASVFRRRSCNIESFTAGHAETAEVYRMTILVDTDKQTARRLVVSLSKLINVISVEDITAKSVVYRELAVIKVILSSTDTRSKVMELVEGFPASVIDIASDALIVEVTNTSDKIDDLLVALQSFGLLEVVRTGQVGMVRGAKSVDVKSPDMSRLSV